MNMMRLFCLGGDETDIDLSVCGAKKLGFRPMLF
jgi:hypothetical protein